MLCPKCDKCVAALTSLRHIEDDYRANYDDKPLVLAGKLRTDPLIKAVFGNQDMLYLDLIGWGAFTNDISGTVAVNIHFFQRGAINTHICSEVGFQDVNLELNKYGKVCEVYQHRSKRYIETKGVFLDVIREQVNAAQQLGIHIRNVSIRCDQACGYAVWPQYGFNAPLPEKILWKMWADTSEATQIWLDKYMVKRRNSG